MTSQNTTIHFTEWMSFSFSFLLELLAVQSFYTESRHNADVISPWTSASSLHWLSLRRDFLMRWNHPLQYSLLQTHSQSLHNVLQIPCLRRSECIRLTVPKHQCCEGMELIVSYGNWFDIWWHEVPLENLIRNLETSTRTPEELFYCSKSVLMYCLC